MENALYAAAAGGHETVVRLLVTIGADVNAQGREYGADINARVERTAMHSVLHHLDVMRRWCPLLLEKGADNQTLRIQFT
jgi:hypothetical protein